MPERKIFEDGKWMTRAEFRAHRYRAFMRRARAEEKARREKDAEYYRELQPLVDEIMREKEKAEVDDDPA